MNPDANQETTEPLDRVTPPARIARWVWIVGFLVAQMAILLSPLLIWRPRSSADTEELIGISVFLGTGWAIFLLGSMWSVLALVPMTRRWILPTLVYAFTAVSYGFAITMIDQRESSLILVIAFAAAWLLAQLLLWPIAKGLGYRLTLMQQDRQSDPTRLQFGIRQLLLITTIAAILLTGLRAAYRHNWLLIFDDTELNAFLFLTVAAAVNLVPLPFACLLRRGALIASLGILVLILFATWYEGYLIQQIFSPVGGPNFSHAIGLNAVQTFWAALYLLLLRRAGYRITTQA